MNQELLKEHSSRSEVTTMTSQPDNGVKRNSGRASKRFCLMPVSGLATAAIADELEKLGREYYKKKRLILKLERKLREIPAVTDQ